MALSARLQIRQTQSLVITPQLMQAIRLLQMSALELERFVAAEIEQNPLIDIDDGASEGSAPLVDVVPADEGLIAASAAEADVEPADLFPEQVGSDDVRPFSLGARTGSGAAAGELGIDPGIAAGESLTAQLESRIGAVFSDPSDRMIALALLAALDDAGYLTVSLSAVGERLGASAGAVERVLRRCQEIAPTGMFARSLAECLALQLAERNRLDPAMQTLLAHLDRLAIGDREGLAALCGVDRDDLAEMIAEIRALDPKPGLAFDHEPVRALVPDVFVRPRPRGGWIVELNDETLPRLIVNRSYAAEVSARTRSDAERRYVADRLQNASWLEKSLDQRARTILRVASEIVRRQESFFTDGVTGLRPLTLRMIADALDVHESTISRAAANKSMATPRGIFELRYFFTGAIAARDGGEAHSAEAVKHRIRKLILEESPDAILSDDAIAAILSRQGVEIARRTVAKYREIMQLGSSLERRRVKQNEPPPARIAG
jgi:RNA polymerase sigma-54 factor